MEVVGVYIWEYCMALPQQSGVVKGKGKGLGGFLMSSYTQTDPVLSHLSFDLDAY